MTIGLDINFDHVMPSETVENQIREQAARLDRFDRAVTGCRVAVRTAHRRGHKNLVEVHVTTDLRGRQIFAEDVIEEPRAAHDVSLVGAVRRAFDRTVRQIESTLASRDRGEGAPAPEGPRIGRVVRLDAGLGQGFIETGSGPDLFFSQAVVENDDFDALAEGQSVQYRPADVTDSVYGPQAAMVRAARRER